MPPRSLHDRQDAGDFLDHSIGRFHLVRYSSTKVVLNSGLDSGKRLASLIPCVFGRYSYLRDIGQPSTTHQPGGGSLERPDCDEILEVG
jgi:hypothetical protein